MNLVKLVGYVKSS